MISLGELYYEGLEKSRYFLMSIIANLQIDFVLNVHTEFLNYN